ncbi:hypothetical protein [Bythopirellula polymerisocia]|nr:hypothetical protein [Bythopirellula polymerisocia]
MLIRNLTLVFATMAVVTFHANAQEVHKYPANIAPKTTLHGGMLHKVGTLQVESVVNAGGLHLFAYDQQGKPLDLRSARGLATLKSPGSAKRYRYDLFPETRKDKSADSLVVATDLSQFTGQQVELAVQLIGVIEGERRPAEFTASIMVPLSKSQQVAAAIEAQGVCPVSGGKLGSMGESIPVTVGDQTVYVCCAGCVDAVKEHPEKYLAVKPTLTVTPTTEADAAAIALQKVCPVMDEPLGGMGTPYKTVVEGRVIYLCCPGCAKLLHANPTEYLAKLADQGVVPPLVRQ